MSTTQSLHGALPLPPGRPGGNSSSQRYGHRGVIACGYEERALAGEQKSLPSFAMVASDLGVALQMSHGNSPDAREFVAHLRELRDGQIPVWLAIHCEPPNPQNALVLASPSRGRLVRIRQREGRTGVSTRRSQARDESLWGGRVAFDVDPHGSGPVDRLGNREGPLGPTNLVMGVLRPAAHSFETGGGDVFRVPVPARAHTAPRRGFSDLGRWSFDGVFVLSESGNAPYRASDEGDGMT